MRFLFTTLAGLGHLHPLVPPARALQASGHAVCFAAAPSLRQSVENSGFELRPAGFDRERDGRSERFVRLQSELADLPATGSARTLFRIRRLFAGLYAEAMASDLAHIASDWRADAIVREAAEFGGCITAEALGLPHASVRSNSMLSSDAARGLVADELAGVRAASGLAPDPQGDMLFRYLHLAFEPPGFEDPALVPRTSHLVRPVPFSASGDEQLPAWVATLPDRPTVYATLGTAFNTGTPGLFEAIIAGLRDEAVELVLTIGRDRHPDELGPQPDNVHIERYVPQSLILPRCDLVVTHGGFNTVCAAMTHGLPMVVIPIDADQPFNAERCAALGVAEVLDHEQRTPERIRAAVQAVLGDPGYRRNAERLRGQIDALPGVEHAVALLERLVSTGAPVLAP